MTFDASINLGTVVQTVTGVVVVVGAYFKIRERLVAIETKLGPMWSWWSEHRVREREEWTKHMETKIDHSVRGAVQAAMWQARRGGDA
jgi:hypothetical protein